MCKRELPATTEYFRKNKKSKDGLLQRCKECNGYHFTIFDPEMDGYKICSKCNKKLKENLDNFYPNKDGKNGLHSVCKKCHKDLSQIYYYEHKKEASIVSKKYYLLHKNKILEKQKDYYYNRGGKKIYKLYSEINKEKLKLYWQKYRKDNKEHRKILAHKRNAKIKQLPNNFTKNDWEFCKSYFDYKCAYCGKDRNLTQDHFIPLNLGGGYIKENIIAVCINCNSSKKRQNFFIWYKEQDFYSVEREIKILEYLILMLENYKGDANTFENHKINMP